MELDWTLYWFMLPVATLVATLAMLSGTGGATYFTPIFLIALPLLGSEYPLQSTAASIGAALLTMVFGFSSGFFAYWRRRLIDFRASLAYVAVAVPVGCAGALLLGALQSYDAALIGAYAVMLLYVAALLGRRGRSAGNAAPATSTAPERSLVTDAGKRYAYRQPHLDKAGVTATGTGAFLTGLLGVGIGEAIMPQLIRRQRIPLPVAAGMSIFISFATIVSASLVQVLSIGAAEIPWNLVCYTIPGVILGGQIGPRLQGRVPQRTMEMAIASLFVAIGIAMGYIALDKFAVL